AADRDAAQQGARAGRPPDPPRAETLCRGEREEKTSRPGPAEAGRRRSLVKLVERTRQFSPAMNAGPVREHPHRAAPPRKVRAAGTPRVLAELRRSRLTAPRPAAGSPTRQPRWGASGRPRSRPPASRALHISRIGSTTPARAPWR